MAWQLGSKCHLLCFCSFYCTMKSANFINIGVASSALALFDDEMQEFFDMEFSTSPQWKESEKCSGLSTSIASQDFEFGMEFATSPRWKECEKRRSSTSTASHDFEFHVASAKRNVYYPADELFLNGRLLPLHQARQTMLNLCVDSSPDLSPDSSSRGGWSASSVSSTSSKDSDLEFDGQDAPPPFLPPPPVSPVNTNAATGMKTNAAAGMKGPQIKKGFFSWKTWFKGIRSNCDARKPTIRASSVNQNKQEALQPKFTVKLDSKADEVTRVRFTNKKSERRVTFCSVSGESAASCRRTDEYKKSSDLHSAVQGAIAHCKISQGNASLGWF